MEHSLALLCIASAGGLAARRVGLPGGTLLGALAAAAVLTAVDARAASLPRPAIPMIQMLVGAMLGLSLNRNLLITLPRHGRLIGATALLTLVMWGVMAVVHAAAGVLAPEGAIVGSAPAGPALSLLVSEQGLPLGVISLLLALRVALVGSVLSVFLKLRDHPRFGAQVHRRGHAEVSNT